MEYSKNRLYSQADSLKQNGWKMAGEDMSPDILSIREPETASLSEAVILPQPMEPLMSAEKVEVEVDVNALEIQKPAWADKPQAYRKEVDISVEMEEFRVQEPNYPGNMRMEPMPKMEKEEAADECGYCITPAMSYTPIQKWGQPYEAEDGFKRGTIFPQMDLPFLGKGGQ